MKALDDIEIQDKINLLHRAGFIVRLEKHKGMRDVYHNDVEAFEYELYVVYREGERVAPAHISTTEYTNKYEGINYCFTKLANKLLVQAIANLIDQAKISPLDIFD